MKNNIAIRRASGNDIIHFYGGLRRPEVIEAYGAFIGEEPIAICGIMHEPCSYGTVFEDGGRIIGFLDATEDLKKIGTRAVLSMLSFLKQNGNDVYVWADDRNYPQAVKLLRVLGFKETGETRKDARNKDNIMRVWKWQA